MARRSWTTSGVDLLLPLDRSGGRRAALESGLRAAIRAGRLQPGARLPSSRALARELGLARGTIVEAYGQLVAEGYLNGRRGSGTTVARTPAGPAPPPTPAPVARRPAADFTPGWPDLTSFPRLPWAAATRAVLRSAAPADFGYGDPRGHAALRNALAGYLGRTRGVLTSPERVLVCGGYGQALGLLCRVLRGAGLNQVTLEDPCIPMHRAIVAGSGLAVAGAGVGPAGIRLDELPATAAAVVVTPAHQFPLGVTATPAVRAGLVAWARKSDGLIVEDDYDGEFRYDRKPVGALQGLDPERIVYAGTAAKVLAPGLRLGWMALPSWLVGPVVEARRTHERHPSVIDQLVLAELIESGAFDRHLRSSRLRYRRRRDWVLAALAERAPRLRPAGVAAGLHVLLRLPEGGPGEEEAVRRAAERSVKLHALGPYRHRPGSGPGGLVVGYGRPAEHAFHSAVDALTGALGELWPA